MPTLRELLALERPTVTIQFRGHPLPVRAVSRGTLDLVRRSIPAITPPIDQATGEANLDDPDFIDMQTERNQKVVAVKIAIGAGLTDSDGRAWEAVDHKGRAAWIEQALAAFRDDLSDEEAMMILAAIEEAGLAGGKRLSSPPTYTAVQVDPSGSRRVIA